MTGRGSNLSRHDASSIPTAGPMPFSTRSCRSATGETRAAGADTAQARAALALLAVRGSRWSEAAIQARGALSAAEGTFHHPFPGEFLSQALGQIALDAPAPQADSVLGYAAARRPG